MGPVVATYSGRLAGVSRAAVVVATEVCWPTRRVPCPSAPLLAGAFDRAGVPVRTGTVTVGADGADHGDGVLDPATGRPATAPKPTWTSVFGDEIVAIGEDRPDVVCLTAAMLRPVGLHGFATRFPERTFDVGIAEQHAVASAAGLALGGLHPVVAVYATFANRVFDQVLMDVALHRLPVTFVLDRAGITGEDGPSHHGMWDLSIMTAIPGLRIAAPRDPATLRQLRGVGIDLGLAFQAIDDWLDVWGDPTVIGKPVGTDLAVDGRSLPVAIASARPARIPSCGRCWRLITNATWPRSPPCSTTRARAPAPATALTSTWPASPTLSAPSPSARRLASSGNQ